MRKFLVAASVFFGGIVAAYGQAALPVIPIVNGAAVSVSNPLPFTLAGSTSDVAQAGQPVILIVNGAPVSGSNPLPVTGSGSGTVGNCGTAGGVAYYPSTGTTIGCSSGITASNTALTLGSGTTITIGVGSAITSSGPGGALGSNAFTSTSYAPLASPTFTGTVTMPDSSTITSSGYGSVAALGVGETVPFAGQIYASSIIRTASAGSASAPSLAIGNSTTGFYSVSTTGLCVADVNGTCEMDWGITNTNRMTVSGGVFQVNGALGLGYQNVILSAPAANIFQVGQSNGTPSAQIFQTGSGSGANIAGVNLTIIGSLSTGTATDGDIIIQTGIKNGSTGSTAATPTTAAIIKGETQQLQLANSIQLASIGSCTAPSGANGNFCVVRGSSGAGFCSFEIVTSTNTQVIVANVPGGC